MNGRTVNRGAQIMALVVAILLAGCENLPGTAKEQGAVAGGVAGAVVGEEVFGGTLGALIGGALGAAGGYLIGANSDRLTGGEENQQEAIAAAQEAERDPATAADVEPGDTADLNENGYVTTDELVALENAGLGNQEILERLRATDQVFVLSEQQKEQLVDAGVSREVVYKLEEINQGQRQRLIGERDDVISQPAE